MSKFKVGDRVRTNSGLTRYISEIREQSCFVDGNWYKESDLVPMSFSEDKLRSVNTSHIIKWLEQIYPDKSSEIRELWPDFFKVEYSPEFIYAFTRMQAGALSIYKLEVISNVWAFIDLTARCFWNHSDSPQKCLDSMPTECKLMIFATFPDFLTWCQEVTKE